MGWNDCCTLYCYSTNYRDFHIASYSEAIKCLRKLYQSGRGMVCGLSSFCNIISRLHSRDAVVCIHVVSYVMKQVIDVSKRGDKALKLAVVVLKRYNY